MFRRFFNQPSKPRSENKPRTQQKTFNYGSIVFLNAAGEEIASNPEQMLFAPDYTTLKDQALQLLLIEANRVNNGVYGDDGSRVMRTAAAVTMGNRTIAFEELAQYVESGSAKIGIRHSITPEYTSDERKTFDIVLGRTDSTPKVTDLARACLQVFDKITPVIMTGDPDLVMRADLETIRSVFPSAIRDPKPNPFPSHFGFYELNV